MFSKMSDTIGLEYIIGLEPPPQKFKLTDNSDLQDSFLITDCSKDLYFTIYSKKVKDDGHFADAKVPYASIEKDGDVVVTGIAFCDDNTTSATKLLEFRLRKGTTDADKCLKGNLFDRIEMQQTCYPASDAPSLHWKRITYLKVTSGASKIEIGTKREPGPVMLQNGRKAFVLEADLVNKPCVITGVGMSNREILCLQIMELPTDSKMKDVIPLIWYGKADAGLGRLKVSEENNEDFRNYINSPKVAANDNPFKNGLRNALLLD